MVAINYLVDRWTIGASSDSRDFLDVDRTGLPKPSKENLSSKPSTRFTTSQSRGDSNRSGKPFQSHEKVPKSSGTVEQESRRRSKNPDIMQSIPFRPMSSDYHLNPIMSYKTANPGLIWETTYEAHLEAFNSEKDNFSWTISDGTNYMRFQGKYYLFTYPPKQALEHSGKANTYLPLQWFSQHALRQEGHTYGIVLVRHRLDFSQSPLTGKETHRGLICVPGLLDYVSQPLLKACWCADVCRRVGSLSYGGYLVKNWVTVASMCQQSNILSVYGTSEYLSFLQTERRQPTGPERTGTSPAKISDDRPIATVYGKAPADRIPVARSISAARLKQIRGRTKSAHFDFGVGGGLEAPLQKPKKKNDHHKAHVYHQCRLLLLVKNP